MVALSAPKILVLLIASLIAAPGVVALPASSKLTPVDGDGNPHKTPKGCPKTYKGKSTYEGHKIEWVKSNDDGKPVSDGHGGIYMLSPSLKNPALICSSSDGSVVWVK